MSDANAGGRQRVSAWSGPPVQVKVNRLFFGAALAAQAGNWPDAISKVRSSTDLLHLRTAILPADMTAHQLHLTKYQSHCTLYCSYLGASSTPASLAEVNIMELQSLLRRTVSHLIHH